MKSKIYTLLIFSLFFTINGCKKSDPIATTDNSGTTGSTVPGSSGSTGSTGTTKVDAGVYIVGSIKTGLATELTAGIWKNGVLTSLSSSPSNAATIAIGSSDIYVAGYYQPGSNKIACYWKNNILTPLTDGTDNATEAYSIALQGSDVYIAGYIGKTFGSNEAVYWKNGTLVKLSNPGISSAATGIAVSGTDVYVSGTCLTSDQREAACYWKNGVFNRLDFDSKTYVAKGLFVNGNDIYCTGFAIDPAVTTSTRTLAVYWKNGVSVKLNAAGSISENANCITVNGSDVYVAGNSTDSNTAAPKAAYWKNGVSIAATGTQIRAIALQGSDLYSVGFTNKIVQPNIKGFATYWKNDAVISTSSENSDYYGIAIAP